MTTPDINAALVRHINSVSKPGMTFTDSQEAYRQWAPTYDKELATLGFTASHLTCQYVCKLVPIDQRQNVRVIDVGAGTGRGARELRREGFTNVDALEPNDAMLDIARRSYLYNNYYVEGLCREPTSLPENAYDILTGSGIYAAEGHVPYDAIYEMIRLVKPGGYITLVTRKSILETTNYINMEKLMDQLEIEERWEQITRDLVGKPKMDYDAIVWQYRVL